MKDLTPIERACFDYMGGVIVQRSGKYYEIRRLWNGRIRVMQVRR